MATNAEHREFAEMWAESARTNYDLVGRDVEAGDVSSTELTVTLIAAAGQAALAQAHATLALGTETT